MTVITNIAEAYYEKQMGFWIHVDSPGMQRMNSQDRSLFLGIA